ncbi:MAG: ribonuclease HII [Oscillospiraceae bacterium]|jgi:ribonuclease HII|nr:ribonuclease HII [Oscillospiraceae bacterium]
MDWSLFEKKAYSQGYKTICGVDEAGRGPLAGPVFAAAVIFPEGTEIDGINDSKKLSPKKREQLCLTIKDKAEAFSVAFATVDEICELNILNASLLAMQRAINALSVVPELALIDGNQLPKIPIKSWAIVKGDTLSYSIASASILAKVARDRVMTSLDLQYPAYGFAKHKGYGTAAHIELIKKYGPCPIHRKTFLKKILK